MSTKQKKTGPNKIKEFQKKLNEVKKEYDKFKKELPDETQSLLQNFVISDKWQEFENIYDKMIQIAIGWQNCETSEMEDITIPSIKKDKLISKLFSSINSILYGQDEMIKVFLACQIAQMNLSLVGDSGCGKTFLAKCFRDSCGLNDISFQMIVGHSEVMESNFIGSWMINEKGKWAERKGPLSPNQARLLAVDEFNRINPRSLAHLLEPMNAKYNDKNQPLGWYDESKKKQFFNVLLMMNPVSQGGNYPPPDAILDRIGYQYFAEPLSEKAMSKLKFKRIPIKPILGAKIDPNEIFSLLVSIQDSLNKLEVRKKLHANAVKICTFIKSPQHYIVLKYRQKYFQENKQAEFYQEKSIIEAKALSFATALIDLDDEIFSETDFNKCKLAKKSKITCRKLVQEKKIDLLDDEDLYILSLIRKLLSSSTARMITDIVDFTLAYIYVNKTIQPKAKNRIEILEADLTTTIKQHGANMFVHRMKFTVSDLHEKIEILNKIIDHALKM